MSRLPHAPYWLVLLLSPAGLAAAAGTATAAATGTPAPAAETPAPAAAPATAAPAGDDADTPHYGWVTREQLQSVPPSRRPKIDPTCPGVWVTPIPAGTRVGDPTLSNIEVQADDVHYDSASTSTLKGRVSIRQPGRRIDADEADLTQLNNEGHFRGNILIAEPGLLLTGDQADFDFASERATIRRTEFVSSVMHAHGRADQIERRPDGRLKIAHGVYSTCPPDNRTWAFEARNIRLNPDKGRGEVSHAVLQVKDVPVFYVPYFNFPIDDRRQSGMLVPRFGNTNDGGFDFAVPVYLNLAPNYDATITPRLMSRRGTMVEGEFRYLLPIGSGQIQGGYLPSDSLYENRDRKSLSWKQAGNITPDLQLNTNVNYVSDNAYFIDLGTDLSIVNTAFQERKGELIYTPGETWSLTTTVQTFQTIDPLLTDVEKPYSRLPQLLFTAGRPVADGFAPALRSELVYFDRQIGDGSGPEINGARLAFDPSVSYVMEAPAGHLIPRLRMRTLEYELTGSGVPGGGTDHESVAVPDASIDGTLIFERTQTTYIQTLEPRLFYLYAPYHDQSELPSFDTANNTFTYQQLFRDSRFAGGDRLDDANQLSMGLTSRIIAPDSGEEIIRASLGQIHYFRDRKVRLTPTTPIGTGDSSGLAGQVAAPIGRGWSSTADALWTPDLKHATQFGVNFNYLPETRDRLANIGYTYRREDPTIGQQAMRQANLSFVQPFAPNWQLIGLWQYDIRTKSALEQVAGVQYEACCWKIRLFDRRFLANADDVSPGAPRERSAFFVEIQLKGLAGLASGVKGLLNNNMFGYNQLVEQNSSRPEFH